MFDFVYGIFFIIMIFEMFLFLFLNLPFPKTWKGGVLQKFATSETGRAFVKVQLVLCLLVVIFYVDLHTT